MKEQLRHALINRDYTAIIELAGRTARVLSFLTALTYDEDPLICWRAVEAMGLAAARIADDNPELVRIHLRRMFWLLNDESGGIGWRLPEAMGEIIRHRPRQFAEFVPLVVALFDMEEEDVVRFRAGILWALGRLSPFFPEKIRAALPWITPCLADSDPQTRGLAVWCLGQLEAADVLIQHEQLRYDQSPVDFYDDGQLTRKSISQLFQKAWQPEANEAYEHTEYKHK